MKVAYRMDRGNDRHGNVVRLLGNDHGDLCCIHADVEKVGTLLAKSVLSVLVYHHRKLRLPHD